MLGPDAGIVEAGGDRVGVDDLAVVVLQQVGAVAVQHARAAARERCGVLPAGDAVTGRLDPDDAHALVAEDGLEHASAVGAAADAGDPHVGPAAPGLPNLHAPIAPDHRLLDP